MPARSIVIARGLARRDYKVGHSEINRQRERAKSTRGTKYDLKAFDDTVVRGGNVPLDVLAKNVDEYVKAMAH